jgi:hypothetical protein
MILTIMALCAAIISVACVGFAWWIVREGRIADRPDQFSYWDDHEGR